MVYNKCASTIIIVDNHITGMTGHQQNPSTGLTLRGEQTHTLDIEAVCKAVGVKHVRVVDPYDLKATEDVLREEIERKGTFGRHHTPSLCSHRKGSRHQGSHQLGPKTSVSPAACV